jgi:hypothetical protein
LQQPILNRGVLYGASGFVFTLVRVLNSGTKYLNSSHPATELGLCPSACFSACQVRIRSRDARKRQKAAADGHNAHERTDAGYGAAPSGISTILTGDRQTGSAFLIPVTNLAGAVQKKTSGACGSAALWSFWPSPLFSTAPDLPPSTTRCGRSYCRRGHALYPQH